MRRHREAPSTRVPRLATRLHQTNLAAQLCGQNASSAMISIALALALLLPRGSGDVGDVRCSSALGCRGQRGPRARILALRGGADDDQDSSDDDESQAHRAVQAAFKRYEPAEVVAATEYISKSLRGQAASGGGHATVGVGAGEVEVRYGSEGKNEKERAEEVDVVLREHGEDGGACFVQC